MKKIITFIMLAVALISCNSKGSKEYDPYAIKDSSKKEVEKSSFQIPFKTTESQIKTIHVKLNNTNGYDAIFDTGCSGMLISKLEMIELIKSGTITENDYVGDAQSSIADGSVINNPIYTIKEISVTDSKGKTHSINNVQATVVDNINAEILIGSTVIDNLAKKSYTVDLRKKTITFE
jgi:hypothetical protein